MSHYTESEMDAMYKEFRDRFIAELGKRLVHQHGVSSDLGRVLLRWSTENEIVKAFKRSENLVKKVGMSNLYGKFNSTEK